MRNKRFYVRVYFQPAFLICVAVLATASTLIRGPSIPSPRPIKKALELLDESRLGPYEVAEKQQITDPDVIRELGTKDYIQWILQDSKAVDGPVKKYMLFITYYERPDRVPHIPEECYAGSGFQSLRSEKVIFELNKPGFERKVRGKYLKFVRQSNEGFPVLYFFRVNEEYASSRNEARIALNKNLLFGEPSYFCKVELVFNQAFSEPSKEEAVGAGEKLLGVILPILEAEHWPDGQETVTGE
jgi:hypothetical protein